MVVLASSPVTVTIFPVAEVSIPSPPIIDSVSESRSIAIVPLSVVRSKSSAVICVSTYVLILSAVARVVLVAVAKVSSSKTAVPPTSVLRIALSTITVPEPSGVILICPLVSVDIIVLPLRLRLSTSRSPVISTAPSIVESPLISTSALTSNVAPSTVTSPATVKLSLIVVSDVAFPIDTAPPEVSVAIFNAPSELVIYEFVPSWYNSKSSPVPNLMLAPSGISI